MRRVLLDCDGVLADFTSEALRVVNRMFGTSYKPDDVTAFDFCSSLGLDSKQAAAVKRAIGEDLEFAARLDVLPGAVEGMRRLREVAEVHIVTSPWNSNRAWVFEREAWLLFHFGIRSKDVTHTGAKHICVGDMLVDDKTETCVRWREVHGKPTVLWSTPHNRRDLWDGLCTSEWDALLEWVERLS